MVETLTSTIGERVPDWLKKLIKESAEKESEDKEDE